MMANSLIDLEYNFKTISENIAKAAIKSGKSENDVVFLAATKTVSADVINHAISLGLSHIGENRVQELLSKYDDYDLTNCDLQFIGHLQTNKVRQIIDKVSMIQSVDSLKLASEISRQAVLKDKQIDVLVEVNIGKEANKSGVLPEETEDLLYMIKDLPNLHIKGLMAIPPICENIQKNCKFFDNMHKMFIDIGNKKIDNISMDILSMGMSDDYQEAILSGSNMVRIGSALFGARNYNV